MHALFHNASRLSLRDINLSKIIGFISVLLGLLVIFGWINNIQELKSINHGLPSMKFNTALGFLSSGIAIILYYEFSNKAIYRSFAAITFFIGFLTLLQYILHLNFLIDELFMIDTEGPVHTSHPGRMSIISAFSFTVIGLALYFDNIRLRSFKFLIEFLKAFVFYLVVLGLISFIFHATSLYFLSDYTSISLPTSIGLLLVIIGVYFLDKNNFYNYLVKGKGSGSIMVRRLLPLSLTLPILLGALVFNTTIFNHNFSFSIYILIITFAFTGLIWYNGWYLQKLESEKKKVTKALVQQTTELERINKSLEAEQEKGQETIRQLNESDDRYKAVTDNANDLITQLDNEGTYQFLSASCKNLLGFESYELLGNNVLDLIHPESKEDVISAIRDVLAGKEIDQLTYRISKKDGTYIWFETTGKLMKGKNGNSNMICVSRDVSNRVKNEEELKEYAARLEVSNKELQSFSYSVSHDLRAPLRSITGFSNILKEDYEKDLDEEGKRLLQIIIRNSQKMGQLIDDLLAFSRLSRQERSDAVIDISSMVKDAIDELMHLYPDRKIDLVINDLPKATGDAAMITQVIKNLMSNAFKYSGKKEMALIEVGADVKIGENIYFIKDNGAGFNMKYADKLFGVFQRLHSSDEFEGTGIGLALVQRIVNRHGGRVWADGEEGKGATFYFSLPVKLINE